MKAVMIFSFVAATLFMGPAFAQQQQQQQLSGTAGFCMKGPTGPIKCEYQTMAQCEQARPQSSLEQCVSRPQAEGTVGGPAQREQAPAPGDQKD